MSPAPSLQSRREFLHGATRGAVWLLLGACLGKFWTRGRRTGTVWQIDPLRCVQCGRCAEHCVLPVSAVKCVHTYAICGYCEICTAFTRPEAHDYSGGAENEVCPTAAIRRRHVESIYYEYTVDEPLCLGCGRCVRNCTAFGNGSLYLQIRHDRCLNCNDCAIARVCPSQAIQRMDAAHPYRLKTPQRSA